MAVPHRIGLVRLAVLCWSVFLTALWLITADPHRGGPFY